MTRTSIRTPGILADEAARDVVLVPGFMDGPSIFWRMDRHLRQRGWTTHAMPLLDRSGRCGLERLGEQLQAFVDERIPPHRRAAVVGFSMGGLVARWYLQRLDGLARVDRLVTIATPHRGTHAARLVGGAGCRQMRPGSAFLAALNADAERLSPTAPVSIWTPFDLTVVPTASAVLPIGRAVRVPVVQHTLMLWSRVVFDVVAETLGSPEAVPALPAAPRQR